MTESKKEGVSGIEFFERFNALPPDLQLLAAERIRRQCSDDPTVNQLCDLMEKIAKAAIK